MRRGSYWSGGMLTEVAALLRPAMPQTAGGILLHSGGTVLHLSFQAKTHRVSLPQQTLQNHELLYFLLRHPWPCIQREALRLHLLVVRKKCSETGWRDHSASKSTQLASTQTRV